MGLVKFLQDRWDRDIFMQRLNTETPKQVFRNLYSRLLEVAEHRGNSAATVRCGGVPQEIDNYGCEN